MDTSPEPSKLNALKLYAKKAWKRVYAWAESSQFAKEFIGAVTGGLVVVLIAHYVFGIG